MLRLMEIFNMTENSLYCYPITSILDICKCYIESNRSTNTVLLPMNDRLNVNSLNEKNAVQRLANIASEFNSLCISSTDEQNEHVTDEILEGVHLYDHDEENRLVINFDVEMFYNFIGLDVNNENVGKLLKLMYESMENNLENAKSRGSSNNLQKVKSLNQRWFKAAKNTIEKLPETNLLSRDYIYQKCGTFYRILSVFKKSYGKWRYEIHADEGESVMVHVQELGFHLNAYIPTKKYYCFKMSKEKRYIGTHITS